MKTKIGRALLSLVIAFGLWLYVVTVVDPEAVQTYYNVPVVMDGGSILESRGLILISSSDIFLDLELSGNRTDLNQLSKDNITVLADLSGITTAGEHTVRYNISYPGSIASGITPLNLGDQQITVKVAEWARKSVPVKEEYIGALPENYTADRQNVTLDHNKVTVSGPKEVIDRIEKAVIFIDLNNRTTDFSQTCEIEFWDEGNQEVTELSHVTANTTSVTASVQVSMFKTIDIVVEVLPGGGLTEEDISYELERSELIVSGTAYALKDLEQIKLTIDLSKLTDSQTLTFDIELPEDVTNVTGVPQVGVAVTIPEMAEISFTVFKNQYECINIPENMEVRFMMEQFTILIRGRENLLNQVTAENIRIIIDFADAVEGSGYYPVTVEIVGIQDVGVVGQYFVPATVSVQSAQTDPDPEG